MGDFYSPVTGFHYSSKEQREAMEKKYMADLENKKLKELQKANQIQQQNAISQQQEQQRQQEEMAESQKQAIFEAEEYRQQEENKRQIIQNVYNEMQRKKELCDKEGIVYSDIADFANNIVKPDEKLREELELEKIKCEKLAKMSEDKESLNNNLKDIINQKQKSKQVGNSSLKSIKYSSIIAAIISVTISLIACISIIIETGNKHIIGIIGWIFFMILLVFLFYKFYKINEKNYYKNKKTMEEKEKELNKKLDEMNKLNINKNLQLSTENVKQLEEKIKKQIQENKDKFNQFRKEHYNDTMEKLFRNLELDTIDVIREKDSTGKGTKEDYIKYMEQYL